MFSCNSPILWSPNKDMFYVLSFQVMQFSTSSKLLTVTLENYNLKKGETCIFQQTPN